MERRDSRRTETLSARWCAMLAIVLLSFATPSSAAAPTLPPGFSAQVYVSGTGFDPGAGGGSAGIPTISTLAFDQAGSLYLARTGRRYSGGEVEDLWPIYRVPLGGARLTRETEGRYRHGPPLPSPQVAAIRNGREVFVSTFDRDRQVGVLYVVLDGRIELFAGGTPARGTPPLLKQPEGAAVDAAGNVYVADRQHGAIVKLEPGGRLMDPRYVSVARPRALAMNDKDHLWIGRDGDAEAPWQRATGEIWRANPRGARSVVLRGPVAAGMGVGPGGNLFVADRHAATIFVVTPEGRTTVFARFAEGDAPRSLCFAPATADTRRAGIGGDLFVITISRGAWPINEVLRISGPFGDLVKE